MERYAEEYDVTIVGGGPDILFFFIDFTVFFPFKNHIYSLTTVYLVFQLQSN